MEYQTMSNIPAELKYVASHEWLRLEEDGTITVGITHHAQELLGDIVFVELPEVGANLAAEEQAGVVESVKAASDVYAPIAGEVVAVNEDLPSAPETANSDPYGAGWFFKIKPANPADYDGLLTAEQYAGEVA
ncbi:MULTISPECIES: glycine cleavage system protein GcvH [Neisseria]|jgi:glycine cleavage system H protein|nr:MULTISPECIES: glycine cleavage system protein GcvH [Neisseria]MBF1296860.1 glycine cleavage system protein GcvH [Neisseria meningitidis]MDU8022947.1 glycine cleavage system protein GcvH [Neisseria sp.]KGJ31362.1 glycine cleavage system protein H [Neisseria mucosa]KZC76205.1 glycine cleavage system H protein [Neisseria flavescens]MCL5077871.1 glycine cleavage system protein GcvH [Neisseria perflava]